MNIKHYAAAGYPAVAVSTSDEDRAVTNVLAAFPKRTVLRIAVTGGLQNARDGKPIDDKASYPAAFSRAGQQAQTVVIVLDFQHVIKNAAMYRLLRDALPAIKAQKSLLVLVAPSWDLPREIEHDLGHISDSLPTRDELNAALDVCTQATDVTLAKNERALLLDSGTGLTLAEFENTAALSYASSGKFDPALIADEKMKLVKQSGLAEISKPAKLSDLGGLGELQRCITGEIVPSMSDPELAVSSVVFDGVEGTGKSLSARIIGGHLGYPVMRIDMASLKAKSGGIVGQSENGLLGVLKLARAVAPVVLFFDEAEKGFAGSSQNTDSGVSGGMLGIILTTMQEIRDNHERIFFVFTTNDFQALPRALTRRIEMKFFVDIPSQFERVEIAAIKLKAYAPNSIVSANDIAELTDEYTGAEIEDVVRGAARQAIAKTGKRDITRDVLESALSDVKPIAKTRADEIRKLREWGTSNLRVANSKAPIAAKGKRTIENVN